MDSLDGYRDDQIELTEDQSRRIVVAFARRLSQWDAGEEVREYLPLARELKDLVSNILYYAEGHD